MSTFAQLFKRDVHKNTLQTQGRSPGTTPRIPDLGVPLITLEPALLTKSPAKRFLDEMFGRQARRVRTL